jgi:hypothetical protein
MARLQRIILRSSLKKRVQNARQIQHAQDNLKQLMEEAFARGVLANKERLRRIAETLNYDDV